MQGEVARFCNTVYSTPLHFSNSVNGLEVGGDIGILCFALDVFANSNSRSLLQSASVGNESAVAAIARIQDGGSVAIICRWDPNFCESPCWLPSVFYYISQLKTLYSGLFSAAVAALLAITIQNLIPNGQNTSAFYLRNIHGVLTDPNRTRTSTPPLVAKPTPFSPPRCAIWVNLLWFLSLVLNPTCALFIASIGPSI